MVKQLTGKILAMGLMMGAAVSAHAAETYNLTCETSRGQSFTLALTSFSFHVGGEASAATGAASGKRESSELLIRFPVSKEYDVLLGAAQEGEVLRSCRLTVGTGTVAATDNWNGAVVSNPKAKGNKANKVSNNEGSKSGPSSGEMEWTFNNGVISGLTAIGTDGSGAAGTPAGTPETLVQATIVAQNFTFVMK
jgi:hypothetical protein